MCRLVWVLNKLLQGVPSEEFPIWFFNPPVQLPEKSSWLGFSKEMDLTRKDIEKRIL
jgi:hypothetical protein